MSTLSTPPDELSYEDFLKVDMRLGTIIEARIFPEARKPAYQLLIDFGPLGIMKSSAQITRRYQPETLIGKQVVAVVNFPKKQIGNFMSECLILGASDDEGDVILLRPDFEGDNGMRIA